MAQRKQTDYIVIHCSASKPSMDVDAQVIDKWHRQFGWSRIGYAYVIKRDGEVEEGRDANAVGAHVKGYNSVSLGICMVGGVDEDMNPENNYTPEQWDSLVELLETLTAKYPDAEILGHRDFPDVKKACPCFDVREWWKTIQSS